MLHYGSAAGELSACLSGVGIVDRSDLIPTRATARPDTIDDLAGRLTGGPLRVGGTTRLAETWCCRPSAGVLLLLSPASAVTRVGRVLRAGRVHHVGIVLDDGPDDSALLGVVGRATPALLTQLGVYDTATGPRAARPCSTTPLNGVESTWLLESDASAVAHVPRADASSARATIEAAGLPLGIARVGQEAFDRFRLVERRRTRLRAT